MRLSIIALGLDEPLVFDSRHACMTEACHSYQRLAEDKSDNIRHERRARRPPYPLSIQGDLKCADSEAHVRTLIQVTLRASVQVVSFFAKPELVSRRLLTSKGPKFLQCTAFRSN